MHHPRALAQKCSRSLERHFAERRKQQARWVACGGNSPPLLPRKRQPGVVVMHLHDRLRVRARVDCTAPTQRAIIHANLRFVHCYFEAVFRNLKARPTPPPVSPAWKVGHCFESAGEPAAKSLTRASIRYASCFAEDSRRSFRATIFEALTDPFARKKTNKVKFHTDFVVRALQNLGRHGEESKRCG